MFPQFVCGRYSFGCPRLLSYLLFPRWRKDLFYYLQLVLIATSYIHKDVVRRMRVSAKNILQFVMI